jgi:SAM-dependent methyltransferase
MSRKISTRKWRIWRFFYAGLYRAPCNMNKQFINSFWNKQAKLIHEKWGNEEHDYEVLGKLLTKFNPRSILDIGCGSGRLFNLFIRNNIQDIIGVDISAEALSIAFELYPQITTIQIRLEDLKFPPDRFDLIISNRVLQHLPAHSIINTLSNLCLMSPLIYINELSESDKEPENFYMFHHDYVSLFAKFGFILNDKGLLGDQTYQIFGRKKTN